MSRPSPASDNLHLATNIQHISTIGKINRRYFVTKTMLFTTFFLVKPILFFSLLLTLFAVNLSQFPENTFPTEWVKILKTIDLTAQECLLYIAHPLCLSAGIRYVSFQDFYCVHVVFQWQLQIVILNQIILLFCSSIFK